jgi:hypothetical protein
MNNLTLPLNPSAIYGVPYFAVWFINQNFSITNYFTNCHSERSLRSEESFDLSALKDSSADLGMTILELICKGQFSVYEPYPNHQSPITRPAAPPPFCVFASLRLCVKQKEGHN